MARKTKVTQSTGPSLPPAKERIMLVAQELFSSHGIGHDLTTIANRATTNVDTIIKYYGSWERLVIEFLRSYSRTIDMRWEEEEDEHPSDPVGQVRGWLAGEEALAAEGEWSSFDLFRAAAHVRPHRHPQVSNYIRALKLKELYRLTARCEAAGFSDPEGLARKLMLLVNGAMAGNLLYGENGPAVELVKAAELMMQAHQPPARPSAPGSSASDARS